MQKEFDLECSAIRGACEQEQKVTNPWFLAVLAEINKGNRRIVVFPLKKEFKIFSVATIKEVVTIFVLNCLFWTLPVHPVWGQKSF